MGQEVVNIEKIVNDDIYSNPMPQVDGVKQVLESLKDRVQPLSPTQMQAIGYLEHLQSRPIHGGKKPYKELISRIQDQSHRVAPPGFFIRVIEALIPRTINVDGKTYEKMQRDNDGR